MYTNHVEVIPKAENKNAGDLEFLIDLALATGYKEWLEKLSAGLIEKEHTVI